MPRPWQTRQEMLTDQALEAAISDPDTIRSIRPAVPQQLMPNRQGMSKQIPTIMDILNEDRYVPTFRSWVSGFPVMQSELLDSEFDGTGRYSMNSLGGA